jgi:type I restriction enzyme M protein
MSTNPANLSGAAKKLLQLVPPDGEFIGNTSLQRRSKLGKRYWKLRSELVDAGFLVRGKGHGGSVKIAGGAEAASLVAKRAKLSVRRESELYEPLRGWLCEEWGKDVESGDFFEVIVTATATGKKRASGQWSRPDITLVQVNSYEYMPQPVLEVTTFEVKKFSDAQNIRSVYETAAHSR